MAKSFINFLRLLAVLAALLVVSVAASAQSAAPAPQPASEIVSSQKSVLDSLTRRTDDIEKRIEESKDSDDKLVDARVALEEISVEVLHSSVAFRPRLAEINARLEQLGPAPAEGQTPETELVSDERTALQAEKAQINVLIGRAEDLSIRVSGLIEKIATMRSELFRKVFTDRYDLMDALGQQTFIDAQHELSTFYQSVASWLRFVVRFKFQAVVGAAILALVAAVVLLVGGRRMFGQLIEADPADDDPSYLTRLSVAFWSTLLPTLALGVFLFSTDFFFNYFNVLRGDIGGFLRSLSGFILIVFCVNRLARAALSPSLPNWRLVPVDTSAARWLVFIATAMALVLGVNGFLREINEQMGAPLSITIARSFVATMTVGLLLIFVGLIRPFRDSEGNARPWPTWLRYALFGIGGFTLAAALLGYIGLALFLSGQVVLTGTLLLLAYIGFLSARAIGDEGGFAGTVFGRRLAAGGKMNEATLDQLGLVVSIGINLMIAAIFVPMILFMWGFQVGDLRAWAYRLATGIQIGSISISITGILTGILVFIAGYFLTRWFQGWLDGSVMARGRVDAGVRNSIRTVVGYAGIALAALVGISAAGLNLSSLALVAGGLSLGIGFGLQNIVSNFVSGLILLAERPFKAGDWIVAGDVSGTVKKISVRATEIETFQRQTMILPNSVLINGAVGNWTHRNKLGRVDIKVNLAYGSDVRKAHAVLLDIARSHPMVLKNPEPFVLFANFGPAALEFEIRVFLADITNGGAVQNDIRFQVVETFAQEHLEIPSAPRAVVESKPDELAHEEPEHAEPEREETVKPPAAKAKAQAETPKPGRQRKQASA
ncbi:mechanosensitive ion channel family protein [Arvimicrobium flavum]|uniref:mechanosensitive ion channel family protein n=1 Tax=Arvimicrobium flavum TaxID=3393320 RepID=UPI00237AC452|nr:mechanosensitive ion channel family protein [Mesorhizobium shangrilense]